EAGVVDCSRRQHRLLDRRGHLLMNVGDRFGSLVYQGPGRKTYQGRFLCDCGEAKEIWVGNVKSGDTVSCGCERRATTAALRASHGASGTPLYQCWKDMKR